MTTVVCTMLGEFTVTVDGRAVPQRRGPAGTPPRS